MTAYYLLVFGVLAAAAFLHGGRPKNKTYIVVACLMLFAVYGLRSAYLLGVDTSSSYLHMYQRMPTTDWQSVNPFARGEYNTLFYFTAKVFAELHLDYQVFVSSIAAFMIITFGHVLYRYSVNPLQSILYYFGLMFFTFHFSALKQSIAMAVLLWAFDGIVDRKLLKYLLLVALAALFHFPSAVFLPAYWIAKIKSGRMYVVFLLVALVLVARFREQILRLMVSFYETDIGVTGARFIGNKVIVMLAIVGAGFLLRLPTKEDGLYTTLLQFMGVAILFQTFAYYNNTFERLADYYFQFGILLIPMIFERGADRSTIIPPRAIATVNDVGSLAFCGFAIWRFLTTVARDPTLTPFKFFFQS